MLVIISSFRILMCVGSELRTKKFLRKGSNMLFLCLELVMDAIEFRTKAWTSLCDRSRRIMALATT